MSVLIKTNSDFLPLVETIRRVIPEYALGYHVGSNIPQTEIVEAAKTVYTTDKYKNEESLEN